MKTKARKTLEEPISVLDDIAAKVREATALFGPLHALPLIPAQLRRYVRAVVDEMPLRAQHATDLAAAMGPRNPQAGKVALSVPELSALVFAAQEWLAVEERLGQGLASGIPLIGAQAAGRPGRKAS